MTARSAVALCLLAPLAACEASPPKPAAIAASRLALIAVAPAADHSDSDELRFRDARTGAVIRTLPDPCHALGKTLIASPAGDAVFETCDQIVSWIPLDGRSPRALGRGGQAMVVSGDGQMVVVVGQGENPVSVLHVDGSAATVLEPEVGIPAPTADGFAAVVQWTKLRHLRGAAAPLGLATTDEPLPTLPVGDSFSGVVASVVRDAPAALTRKRDDQTWLARVDASGHIVDLAKTGSLHSSIQAVTASYVMFEDQPTYEETRILRVGLASPAPPVVVIDLPDRSHLTPEAFDPRGRVVLARSSETATADEWTCIDVATGATCGHYHLPADERVVETLIDLGAKPE